MNQLDATMLCWSIRSAQSWSYRWIKHCCSSEMILQINKALLHLVGSSVLLYLIDDARSNKIKFVVYVHIYSIENYNKYTVHAWPCRADHDLSYLSFCPNGGLVTRKVACLTVAKFQPHIFWVWYYISQGSNIILVVLQDFCLLPA